MVHLTQAQWGNLPSDVRAVLSDQSWKQLRAQHKDNQSKQKRTPPEALLWTQATLQRVEDGFSGVWPFPPSMNHYWRRVGARTLVSRAGRGYKAAVLAIASGQEPLTGKVEVEMHLFSVGRFDVDNYLKVFLDSAKGLLFGDDSQVDRIVIDKTTGTPKRIEFAVRPTQKTDTRARGR